MTVDHDGRRHLADGLQLFFAGKLHSDYFVEVYAQPYLRSRDVGLRRLADELGMFYLDWEGHYREGEPEQLPQVIAFLNSDRELLDS